MTLNQASSTITAASRKAIESGLLVFQQNEDGKADVLVNAASQTLANVTAEDRKLLATLTPEQLLKKMEDMLDYHRRLRDSKTESKRGRPRKSRDAEPVTVDQESTEGAVSNSSDSSDSEHSPRAQRSSQVTRGRGGKRGPGRPPRDGTDKPGRKRKQAAKFQTIKKK